jgi:hypothetical protein
MFNSNEFSGRMQRGNRPKTISLFLSIQAVE